MNHKHFIEDQKLLDQITHLVKNEGLVYENAIYNALDMGKDAWLGLKQAPNSAISETIARAKGALYREIYGYHMAFVKGAHGPKLQSIHVKDHLAKLDRQQGIADQLVQHNVTKFDEMDVEQLEKDFDEQHATH